MANQPVPGAILERRLAQASHQDPGIRVVAREQLAQYQGDERAGRRLMEGFKDPDPDFRSTASGLLGQEAPEERPRRPHPVIINKYTLQKGGDAKGAIGT